MSKFRDEYHQKVKKDLKKIDKSVESEVRDLHIPKILSDPYISDDLTGGLAGIRSYHFKKKKSSIAFLILLMRCKRLYTS